jgi:hypothetical protein
MRKTVNLHNNYDIDYEAMDDLPLSEHVDWNQYNSTKYNMDDLDFEQESKDYFMQKENFDFESD